jgi:hypothetical protein
MGREFQARRDLVVQRLAERLPGAGYVAPEGAFYLFFRADQWYDDRCPDSIALCKALIEEAEVALVPGAAFGDDRYVRLSFAASRDGPGGGVRPAGAGVGVRVTLSLQKAGEGEGGGGGGGTAGARRAGGRLRDCSYFVDSFLAI